MVRFAQVYGWRAYAIPVLAVLTVWVLVDIFTNPDTTVFPVNSMRVGTSANTDSHSQGLGQGPDPARAERPTIAEGALPPGPSFSVKGSGKYRLVGQPGAAAGEGKEAVFRYVIEIEDGVDTSAYGGDDAFVSMVDATLTSPKGWTHDPRFRFEHIAGDSGEIPDLRIQLSSVETTHSSCGNDISMETSCFNSIGNRVIINESRWVRGASTFLGDLGGYRQYLLNHEVGHGIGYGQHAPCGGANELAPVMMQQTLSLSNSELNALNPDEVYPDDGFECKPNPWPYPFA
ncbi:DUF3152 domain-containing protein [Corynebacterium sp. ES2715-CONJ3]|uniref:DUF3152 domain-containing protein n=1 Tax=Corynebacterium sp. ES2715-CONJ3 TaxID=2974028 RepID=UPI00216A3CA7|nr:DUF3152 domain-containing protein [Corynebacterium sp. ES2715-CONJ3]MCS4491524.1 DUF3152 domain-containing protein [Corynebacterium sp. ES2715-CONJ3]